MSGIQSSDSLAVPDAWAAAPNRRHRNAIFALFILAVLALVIAGYQYAQERFLPGSVVACFAVLLVAWATIGADARLRHKPNATKLYSALTTSGRNATGIPYSAGQFAGYLFVMGWIALGLLVSAVLAATSNDPTVRNATVIFIIGGLLCLSFPAVVVIGWFRRGHILLSPDGVHQRGWTFESFLPWSAITSIQPYMLDGPQVWVMASGNDHQWERKQFTRLWRQDRLPDQPVIRILSKDVAADLTFIYHLIGYYYLRPASRNELGTSTALDRARRADFT